MLQPLSLLCAMVPAVCLPGAAAITAGSTAHLVRPVVSAPLDHAVVTNRRVAGQWWQDTRAYSSVGAANHQYGVVDHGDKPWSLIPGDGYVGSSEPRPVYDPAKKKAEAKKAEAGQPEAKQKLEAKKKEEAKKRADARKRADQNKSDSKSDKRKSKKSDKKKSDSKKKKEQSDSGKQKSDKKPDKRKPKKSDKKKSDSKKKGDSGKKKSGKKKPS